MINIEKKKNIYTFFLVFFIFIFYFFGFYYREITNGAGHSDLQYHIWLLVNDFDTDFIGTLKNYISYKEATFPFFHIIQAKLNPFKTSVIAYCLFNTILNLLILLLFYFFLKKKEIFK